MPLDWNADDTLDWAYYEKKAATDAAYIHTGALGVLLHQIMNDIFDRDPDDEDLGGNGQNAWWAVIVPAEYFEGYHDGVPAPLRGITAAIVSEDDGVIYMDLYRGPDDADYARSNFREMR